MPERRIAGPAGCGRPQGSRPRAVGPRGMTAVQTAVLALLLVAILAPVAEAKGSSSGSRGRRASCTATDTDRDGIVSEAEKDEQCGSTDWVEPVVYGGFALAGLGGVVVRNRLKDRRAGSGVPGLAAVPAPHLAARDARAGLAQRATAGPLGRIMVAGYAAEVRGVIHWRNGEGDRWSESCLQLQGRTLWLEEDEGTLRLHVEAPEPATFDPPTLAGQKVRVREQGVQHVVSTQGTLPPGEAVTSKYVDGRLPGGPDVSLEADATGVGAYRSFPVRMDGTNLRLDQDAITAVFR